MKGENGSANQIELVTLSPEEAAARKSRNKAIALCLVGLIIIFFVATFSRFAPNQNNAPATQVEGQ